MSAVSNFLERVPQPVFLGLAAVGALFLGSKLYSYLQLVLSAFVLSGTSLSKYGKPGSWVVITGASDGLGKEFAFQLAAKRFNLVLVSRTHSKLVSLAAEIEEKNAGKGVQVKTLAMDFNENNDADYERLRELVRGLDVAILLNNVGRSHDMPVPFLETPTEELEGIIKVNCIGTLKTTQVIAPILQERKRGLILTMGSTAGWAPTPLLATYGGSKSFLLHWNSALAAELSDYNVDCYLVLSHLVTTAMSKIRRPSLNIPSAKNFVRVALGKIGLGSFVNASSTYVPWWPHAFMIWAVEQIPGVTSPIVIGINKRMHIDIRKRALRKRERDAKKA
ncbi:hypothetical protein S40285_07910 [Stachybotrys chlorohalonatus IBT 40285]|uniref:Very-long-chain 3-oxoacyl-CoA reductase n=1 Tax=Stachybotrys chlorohalonatus (strain IBT 40285) TaxID=1283841 RepID=A0A084QDG2_STAC4|nr:hypothetical protein S40285_07910 [Stachybotrys chlorohalonata IBT 40285]